jgi:hypothetical protein
MERAPCTDPYVLLRWRARYSAVARTAIWDFSSAIFGVWFFTVKQGPAFDMLACLRFN